MAQNIEIKEENWMVIVLEFKARKKPKPTSEPSLHFPEATAISLLESRAYAMAGLRKEMRLAISTDQTHPLLRSHRPFTQKFCKIIRSTAGISLVQLSERLNAHPGIQKLSELPGAYRFFPLTAEFLKNLESNISEIMEYQPYGGGFLGIGAYGAPTAYIAKAIAEVCDANRDFRRFEVLCAEYLHASRACRLR